MQKRHLNYSSIKRDSRRGSDTIGFPDYQSGQVIFPLLAFPVNKDNMAHFRCVF